MPKREFDIYTTRDGQWWMVHVPGLDGYVGSDGSINVGDLTQARHRGEVELMAREYISLVVEIPVDEVIVRMVDPPG
jgi:hypothetical protein